ncbi:hypothetical protein TgHK011_009452 [Trichoderma gracile]|nr:hypothetical protein TgHK011_009452 [Trichoderma gracile]
MNRLPAELMLLIMRDSQLDSSDLRRLRLVSEQVSAAATSRLFAHIHISKLHSDRETFFNIATQPHLAVAVRSVTWLELAEDNTDLPYVSYPPVEWLRLPQETVPSGGDADDLDFLFRRLPRMARTLFWLPFEYQEGTEQRMKAISSFMPEFFAALDQMPNLREFASRPMHPARELVQPSGLSTPSYPFTCQLFRQNTGRKTMQRNDGIKLVAVPFSAMQILGLIERTARSLRRIAFDNCNVPGRLLYALQLIPDLSLESFTSVSATVLHETEDELENTIWLMTEAHALAVIRGQNLFDGAFELGQAIAQRTIYLYTHFYAPSLLRVSCFNRHGHDRQPVVKYLTVESRDDADYNSDGGDKDETDTEEASELNDELAEAPPGLLKNDDESYSNDSDSDLGSHKEAAAEASIQKMLATAPRWEVGIGRDGTACCWRVTAARSLHEGYPTRVWRFLHRNGEQAFGDEPLEFWDDWEGSQSGDCYEPTPFGRELDSFMSQHSLQGIELTANIIVIGPSSVCYKIEVADRTANGQLLRASPLGEDVLGISMLSGRTRQAKNGITISLLCEWLRVLCKTDGAKLIAITDTSQVRIYLSDEACYNGRAGRA